MDGLYELTAKTPMGNLSGNLKIMTNGNSLTGYLDFMGKRYDFNNGTVNGNKFNFSGMIRTNFKVIRYEVQGELMNNRLNVFAKTNMGSFNLQGRKISYNQ